MPSLNEAQDSRARFAFVRSEKTHNIPGNLILMSNLNKANSSLLATIQIWHSPEALSKRLFKDVL